MVTHNESQEHRWYPINRLVLANYAAQGLCNTHKCIPVPIFSFNSRATCEEKACVFNPGSSPMPISSDLDPPTTHCPVSTVAFSGSTSRLLALLLWV